ncbi:MAG: FAD-binding oxidoreductase [bacterium]|nr:FAD-binding oxidoreductase [bacterium]
MTFTPITSEHVAMLIQLAGAENVSVAQSERDLHARDQSYHPAHPADVVIFGTSAEQISRVVAYANAHHIPITPWGVGTGLEGGSIPVHGGISLSLERMTTIIEVHADDFQVTVQAGLGHKDLNKQLAKYGLFFPPDPGANASIGGMLANNAAGIRTVKYGASKDNVLKMQVVLADGRIIEVGSRSIKQSSGYDLLHLFVGSEGTLGIITQATLKLVPIPQHMSAMVASFPSVESAIQAVVALKGSGLDPAALEFIDAEHCRLLSEAEGIDLPQYPTLFIEFHAGQSAWLIEGIEMATQLCRELGALTIRATTDSTERLKLWHARHHSYEILVRANPTKKILVMDVAVPISAYPTLIDYVESLRPTVPLQITMVGHAGDGNIHVEFAYGDEAEFDHAMACDRKIVEKALSLGGTATGEHGVGMGKAQFMPTEHGEAFTVMKTIKHTLDPNNILNPSKIFLDE